MKLFKKIVCPVDFSETSVEAVETANWLALHFSAELYLLHVVSMVPLIPTPGATAATAAANFDVPLYQEKVEAHSKDSLDKILREKTSEDIKVHSIIRRGKEAEEIVRFTEENDIDVIVLAKHGKSGFQRFLFGSTAEKVMRLATCHILVTREFLEE
jgi:nucleotide-binding universal stress UspA family protein